ncbi:MAG: MAPEG family protein [Alphaproteobacteria bacterium]|nr:MAPEG family protein [Alphaproteobacteria bacterium]
MLSSELSILLIYGLITAIALGLKTTGMLATVDMGYLLSSRDEERTLEGMLGRMNRAINNSVTAMALFAPPVLVIALRDQSSAQSLLAAQVFLAARIVYLPAYVFGIRGLRTLVWTIGFLATLLLYFLAL